MLNRTKSVRAGREFYLLDDDKTWDEARKEEFHKRVGPPLALLPDPVLEGVFDRAGLREALALAATCRRARQTLYAVSPKGRRVWQECKYVEALIKLNLHRREALAFAHLLGFGSAYEWVRANFKPPILYVRRKALYGASH